MRVVLRDVGPELAGHGCPGRAAAQAQMSDQALCAPRQVVDVLVHAVATGS